MARVPVAALPSTHHTPANTSLWAACALARLIVVEKVVVPAGSEFVFAAPIQPEVALSAMPWMFPLLRITAALPLTVQFASFWPPAEAGGSFAASVPVSSGDTCDAEWLKYSALLALPSVTLLVRSE